MKSIFTDKLSKPTAAQVKQALGDTYIIWQTLVSIAKKSVDKTNEEWKYSGEKYGWSFLIRDQKRVLVYFLPRAGFFKVAMVFGQKATDCILERHVSQSIKDELKASKVYAEGRGIRLEIRTENQVEDIRKLIECKKGV